MSFVQFPVSGNLQVANVSALPATANQGDLAVAQDTGEVYLFYNGGWDPIAGPSGGANTALSNLASPTAINRSLLPGVTDTLTLGSASKAWADISTYELDLLGATSGAVSLQTAATSTNSALTIQPMVDSTGNLLVQQGSSGQVFIGANATIGGANSGIQYSNATVANRGQIKLHSYFNGTSVSGVSTLTSRSGTVAVNAAVVAGQDYSKWTAQAAATTPGSAPISGTFAFKANTVNSLTVTSDFHVALTNLAGTLADALYLTSEGLLTVAGLTLKGSSSGSIAINAAATTTPYSVILPAAQATGALTNDGSGNLSWTPTSSIATGNLTDTGTDGISISNGTNAVVGTGTVIAQHVADTTHNGYLSSTDWNTFNGKQAPLTLGNLTDVGTDGITVTGGTNAVVGSGTSIAQQQADASHNGYLSMTDWQAFNSKQTTITIGAFDSQALNANGLALVSNALSTQSADGTHPGMVNTTTQTFAGVKTFSSAPVLSSLTANTAVILNGANATASLAFTASGGTSNLVSRDLNGVTFLNNLVTGTTFSASAGGTITLTASSGQRQVLTGSTTETFKLPDATMLNVGTTYVFSNTSTGLLTVNNNNNSLVTTVLPGAYKQVFATDVSTTSGTWDSHSLTASNSDWGTAGLTVGGTIAASNLSGTNTGDVTLGTANGLSLSSQILSLQAADTSNTGALTSTDWNTFNGKQAAGSYITALTGDIAASGPGSAAATLATVNTNVGSFTNANITVNAKGLITAAANGSSGTLPIANGGTGQTTASAAFNALSPMTTGGDIIYGSASGAGTRLANGSSGQVLTSAGGTSAPTWSTITTGTQTITAVQNSNYIVTTADNVVQTNASGGGFNVTLFTASGNTGATVSITRLDQTLANQVTVLGNGGQTIRGQASFKLATQYETIKLISDGSNWQLLEHSYPTGWTTYSLTVGATTTPPTFGTVVHNVAQWRRNGDSVELSYAFQQSSAGTTGTGMYLFPIPANMTIDTGKFTLPTTAGTQTVLNTGASYAGSGSVASTTGANTNFAPFTFMTVFNSTNLCMSMVNSDAAAAEHLFPFGSSGSPVPTATPFWMTFAAKVPITNWES